MNNVFFLPHLEKCLQTQMFTDEKQRFLKSEYSPTEGHDNICSDEMIAAMKW